MRMIPVIAALLAGCGGGDQPADHEPDAAAQRGRASAASFAPVIVNPLIGVWARISGTGCRVEQVEFTAAQMTAEISSSAPMKTTAVRYRLVDPHAPEAVPSDAPPLRFRVIDTDHIRDDADCVLGRAD